MHFAKKIIPMLRRLAGHLLTRSIRLTKVGTSEDNKSAGMACAAALTDGVFFVSRFVRLDPASLQVHGSQHRRGATMVFV